MQEDNAQAIRVVDMGSNAAWVAAMRGNLTLLRKRVHPPSKETGLDSLYAACEEMQGFTDAAEVALGMRQEILTLYYSLVQQKREPLPDRSYWELDASIRSASADWNKCAKRVHELLDRAQSMESRVATYLYATLRTVDGKSFEQLAEAVKNVSAALVSILNARHHDDSDGPHTEWIEAESYWQRWIVQVMDARAVEMEVVASARAAQLDAEVAQSDRQIGRAHV